MLGKFLSELSKNATYALVFGRFLKREGGARLLTNSETGNLLSPRNTGLLIDGNEGRLSERESFQNVCVVARVGAGKTSRYIIPNVLDKAKRNCSIVVNDPKGEVFAETSGYLQSRGFFEAIAGKVIEVRKDKIEDVTQQRHEYNLLNADAIRRIGDTQALLVSGNRNPAIIETTPYFQHRRLSRIPKRYGAAHLSKQQNAASIKRVPLS